MPDKTIFPPPFSVPRHPLMHVAIAGVRPSTVLTIETQIANVVINEYESPLTWCRQWSYSTVDEAIVALALFKQDETNEPAGWIRAIDEQGVHRNQTKIEAD